MSRPQDMAILAQRQSGPIRASIRRSMPGTRDLVVVLDHLDVATCRYDIVSVMDAVDYFDTMKALAAIREDLPRVLAEVRGEHIRRELVG
jgi:hypothetical protein